MTPAVTAAYEWSQFPVIADIGGGIGTQLVSVLEASPASKGILFDQPYLGPESISHDRMEAIGGDFFESVPTGADAYLLRWILHDWADPEAALILGSLHQAMKPTARLIVIESVIPEGPAFNFGKWSDLQMLVCVGGRERTETEYRALLTAAGFDLTGSGCYSFAAEPPSRKTSVAPKTNARPSNTSHAPGSERTRAKR